VSDIIERLGAVIDGRRGAPPESSYVASLFRDGLDKILKKLGEEAIETIVAAKGGRAQEVVYEAADLWFHAIILLKYLDIEPSVVLAELERRFGQSGLAEKASRPSSHPAT
jgi:phosphoribosyl-ATP pyrophosphohydrolase